VVRDKIYQVFEDFHSDDPYHFKTFFALNAVDEHVAMYTDEVFTIQYRIFVLYKIVN
jgi:hypothetical protein